MINPFESGFIPWLKTSGVLTLPLYFDRALCPWHQSSVNVEFRFSATDKDVEVKKFTPGFRPQRLNHWGLGLILTVLLFSCANNEIPIVSTALNSRYTEEKPALSGDGRFLAFISHRNSSHQLLIYDLQQQRFISTPRLNRRRIIIESPSLSYTARYIVYITSDRGRPVVGLYDRATQYSQILTPNYRGWVRNPSISPDGRYVVFESTIRGQWDIEILDRGPNIELDIPNGAQVPAPPGNGGVEE